MNFIDAISVLSKSSSYAVSTESDLDAALSAIKSDLYVVMPIEEHLFELLESIKEDSKKVIFLFHGFNEKDWTKYMPWANKICEGTGCSVSSS